MKLTILGSGGATPTPRQFCQCATCKKAREEGEPYKRNSSSLYIKDIYSLVDCPEDIGDSLNRRDIKKIDNLFITHWHPDHTFGLRVLLEAYFDFRENRPKKQVMIYIPKKVFEDLKLHYPTISYLSDGIKVAKIKYIEHHQSVKIGNIKITAIGYEGKDSNTFAYLFGENRKKVLYAPCDTINFHQRIYDLDLLINECGLFSYKKIKQEIGFPTLMKRLKLLKPKRTILTHIEEIEINRWGWPYLEKMRKKYSDIHFEYGHDGMEITLSN